MGNAYAGAHQREVSHALGRGVYHARARFIQDYRSGLYTLTELCERFRVSRKTGYKWVRRFEQGGASGLEDRSRAPHRCPHRMPAAASECAAVPGGDDPASATSAAEVGPPRSPHVRGPVSNVSGIL